MRRTFLLEEFSSADHLNIITTNINTYFNYLLAKTMR